MVQVSIVAVDACAWPVLVRLRDGIGLVHFNRPCHGTGEGDLAARVSRDEGVTWQDRGLPAPHLPGSNRSHIASGLNHAGQWMVLSNGHNVQDGAIRSLGNIWCSVLRGAESHWGINCHPTIDVPASPTIPHGRILALADNLLVATVYRSWGTGQPSRTWIVRSRDGGNTWGDASEIGTGDCNEAVLLDRGNSGLLAVVRTHRDHHLELYTSNDTGNTWVPNGPLTLPMQHPGDLTDLGENRILLTYGIRNRGLMGIGARLSKDGGTTWGAPVVIYQFGEATDCGYPSSLRCNDGSIVTACYTDQSPVHTGYHLLTLRWSLSDFLIPKALSTISDNKPMQA